MNLPTIIDHAASDEQDIPCATCGRKVKRAVGFSDRPGYHGLDCAARILGRPKSRQSFDAIEHEARIAKARASGTAAGDAMRRAMGRLPSRGDIEREGCSPLESHARHVALRARLHAPYPEHSAESHAWNDAAATEWGRK